MLNNQAWIGFSFVYESMCISFDLQEYILELIWLDLNICTYISKTPDHLRFYNNAPSLWAGRWKSYLTNWGRATHICVVILTIIASYTGLSPGQRQTIIWINAGILLFGLLETKCSEILIKIHAYAFKKTCLKCWLESGGHFVSASMCQRSKEDS